MSLHFNQLDIDEAIEDIFRAGTRIEVAFDLEGELPIVLPTSIHGCDYAANRMLIYQTRPEVLPSFKYQSMDIAILLEKELNRMVRVGLRCRIIKFLNKHRISERVTDNFFVIEYDPRLRKINLRTTYRLRTSLRYNVEATIRLGNATYVSGTYFTVQDISVTGVGFLVPRRVGKKDNPLLNIPLDTQIPILLTLAEAQSDQKPFRISTDIEIARKSVANTATNGFIGARFGQLDPEDQEKLFKYIHNAQLYEIRNIKRI